MGELQQQTAIILAGPTAVGKTAIAIELARHFNTAIISADSRQCYRELNIGVAKPSTRELAMAPHYFINSHSLHERVNAAVFEKYALEKAAAIFSQHQTLIVAGGTGLYINSFCEGMDEVPDIDPGIREQITADYQLYGLEWLQKALYKFDPDYFQTGELLNPHRLMRALEVRLATGNPLRHYFTTSKEKRNFRIIKIGLELPRELLYQRINERVDAMVEAGLKEEAKQLLPHAHLTALQTVGYREWFQHFEGMLDQKAAIDAIKTNTRRYAKRQMTWFRKDGLVHWCPPRFEAVIEHIKKAGI